MFTHFMFTQNRRLDMKDFSKIEQQDKDFWDSLNLAIISIFDSSCTYQYHWINNPNTGDVRIVAYLTDPAYHQLEAVYDFFRTSPERFVPDQNFLIDAKSEMPTAYKKRDLLVTLWTLAGAENARAREVCKRLDAIFQYEGSCEDAVSGFNQHPKQIREARLCLDNLYIQWVKYVKRHYNRGLKGLDDLGKWLFQCRLIEGKRNQEIRGFGPSLADAFGRFKLFDKTLCLLYPLSDSIDAKVGSSITNEILRNQMQQYQFPEKYTAEIKKLLRLHQKILCKDPMSNVQPYPFTACFAFVWKNQTYYIYYHKDQKKFSVASAPGKHKYPGLKKVYLHETKRVGLPKEYLFALTDGNWNNLCNFAKTTALAVSVDKLYPGAVIVSEHCAPALAIMLEWISGRSALDSVLPIPLSSLAKVNTKDFLIDSKIDGRMFAFCKDDMQRLNKEQRTRLKKILSGKSVTYRDAVLGRKIHKNTMQWFIIGNDLTFQKLIADDIKTKQAPMLCLPQGLNDGPSLWMQIVLPLWGFLLLQDKKKAEMPSEKVMPAVQYFMKHCCHLLPEDGEFLPARELYENYVKFCAMCHRSDVLKFKDFNDILETEYGQERVRRHRTSGENKTGYLRIRFLGIDSSTFRTVPPSPSEREKFYSQLDRITDEVKAHFSAWPFEELF